MDKWVVNNFIVQMRNSVTQARVHTLNKLVREIRKLQAKRGTAEQKEKNCRKAERFKQEVIFIKKLDLDEISKYALLCTENPSETLNKVFLPIEERAKVRLSAHKSVVHQVELFRSKNPDWALKLPPLLVQLGLKNKNKNKTVNQNNNNVTVKPSMKESARNSENKNKLGEVSDESESSDKDSCSLRTRDNTSAPANSHMGDQKVNSITHVLSNNCEKKKKTNGVAEVRRFAELLESGRNSETLENESPASEDKIPNPTNAVSDPFFLGDNSDEDLDSSKEEEERTKNYDSNKKQFFMKTLGKRDKHVVNQDWNFEKKFSSERQFSKNDQKPTMNRKQRRMLERTRGKEPGVNGNLTFGIHNSFPKYFEASVKKKFTQEREQTDLSRGRTAEKQEILHPSWEAKRKQREQQILPFQGKKIKFDDDD